MAKKIYKLNPHTLTYDAIDTPVRLRVYRFLRKILIGFILVSIVNFVFSYFFYTPKMASIMRENREVELRYAILQDKVNATAGKLADIQHRDVNVYRMLFAADSLDMPSVYRSYPDSKYARFEGDDYQDMITGTWKSVDDLARRLYRQSVSLDQLQTFSLDKEQMSLSIPAIWPVDRKLIRNIGAYGPRIHPILKTSHIHSGIDLSGNRGTPIYATGDGVVVADPGRGTGYGIQIIVDHGYGYKTRYAHLDAKLVSPGQRVKRGEMIGLMGNTGRSTSSHLHYEVIYLGHHVDPINYLSKDMEEEEFLRIVESAKETTFETFD